MPRPPSILLLAPQLYGDPGGIQTYLRRLWEIVSTYGENRGSLVRCLSLNDDREEGQRHPRPVRHDRFFGCRGNKLTFVAKALASAWKHPDSLVIVGHIKQTPVAWILKKLGLIRSYVLVIYGIEAWSRLRWLQRKAAKNAARVVAITWYTAQEFSQHNGAGLERFRIIAPTLAEDEINPALGAVRNGHGELRVLTVGRLSSHDRLKGIDTIIEAVGKTRNAGVDISLTVVGKGDDLLRLREIAKKLALDKEVRFLGAVPDDALLDIYQKCDVFAMPSKKEGFGIVFLEAMRYQKPCIGGNHAGIPEIIDHGVNGYLVNYDDVDRLAGYFIEFSQNSWLRQDMGLKAYEKVKSHYLFPHMANKWIALLDESFERVSE